MKSYMRTKTQAAMVTAVHSARNYIKCTGGLSYERVVDQLEEAIRLVGEDANNRLIEPAFDGAYYDPARDDDRLSRQIGRVFDVMSDGQWHTLGGISQTTGDPAASVSAQIRHLRKPKHGQWIVDTECRDPEATPGLFSYRLRNPDGTELPPIRPQYVGPTNGSGPLVQTSLFL